MDVYGEKGVVVEDSVRIGRIDLSSLSRGGLKESLYEFDCVYLSEVERGFGKIEKITYNSLFVRIKNKQELELKLGLCSRLESISTLYPGLIVYYEALRRETGYYLYKGSCF